MLSRVWPSPPRRGPAGAAGHRRRRRQAWQSLDGHHPAEHLTSRGGETETDPLHLQASSPDQVLGSSSRRGRQPPSGAAPAPACPLGPTNLPEPATVRSPAVGRASGRESVGESGADSELAPVVPAVVDKEGRDGGERGARLVVESMIVSLMHRSLMSFVIVSLMQSSSAVFSCREAYY